MAEEVSKACQWQHHVLSSELVCHIFAMQSNTVNVSRPSFDPLSQSWKVAVTGGKFLPDPEMYEKKYNKGMETYIQNLGPNEWRIAHSHLTNNYLNESDDILNLWRTTVESQGCQLINTVMLRDPLNHAMSLHKVMKSKNSTRDEWTEHLKTPTGLGKVRARPIL